MRFALVVLSTSFGAVLIDAWSSRGKGRYVIVDQSIRSDSGLFFGVVLDTYVHIVLSGFIYILLQ